LVGHKLDLSRKLNASGDVAVSNGRDQIAAGNFVDGQKRRWAYVAVALRPALANTNWMVIARPFLSGPVISLQGESLALPFVEAGIVALILAAVIAALVARSIARPIQKVAAGANAIAQGKYDQRVELSGPEEFKQLADDFNQMAARVQNAQKTERDFVANVSHELKTPLTSIKGFAQAIQDGAVSDPESILSAARIINDEADRLTRLVTGLLDSARLETGDIKMEMQRLSINDVARSCLARFAPRAESAGITLQNNLAELPVIRADGDRLAQVVTNLLDNAIKHTERGGKVSIESKGAPASKSRPAGIELSVVDTGKGIPADDLPRIFERFYQVDKARVQTDGNTPSGTGLGLAICKQIIEAHHGMISAESVQGIGTRISVWLPVTQTT
jgi:two-component system OmpR family sensor kinase